ncbi:MAG TPA: ATP-binding cassette domain-containing protein, partial [Candidatus Acidoferrales bacterium]|nr:ATP-binding cassette domain-containing protein [Candidatus Acidoferrales bacterium]
MKLLETEGLTRRFGGLLAVNSVSLKLEEGEIVGVIGPNGAGKSTLFGLIAGALRPSSGRVKFAARDVTGWPSDAAARAGVGRTYQIVRIFRSMSVLDNVLVGAYLREPRPRLARQAAWSVLERVGLAEQAARPA